MNKNTVLAIGLSAIVILASQYFLAPKPEDIAKAQNQTQTEVAKEAASAKAAEVVVEKVEPVVSAPVQTENTFEISTEYVNYTFNEVTGNIKSAVINKYHSRELENIFFARLTATEPIEAAPALMFVSFLLRLPVRKA